ncbi:transporter substrate-binding domain-containing protein [Natronoglomus mannanivorans]|uniref:Transporter substrate-binding domain-containing protein n=1 Tax=Natronoglomus mannanivorans TaxID=2979990 RepID=A0AAP2YXP1_9EURY|nr:transporter substrate-binding domain-containing protein [Halobacteria archaeon AArc-xg1-1]
MDEYDRTFDRRGYLKWTGATGIAATVGLAGCLEDADDGNGDGNGDETGNGVDDETDDEDGEEAGDEDEDEDEDDDTEAGGEIVAGTASGFPPFEMVEDGELVGFDIDLLEAAVAETDYELTGWEDLGFDGLIPALENENIDVIAAAMTITEEREETVSFTDPYYSADQSVLVQTDGDFEPEELEDLAGQALGAQSGTTGEGVVEEQIEDGTFDEGDYRSYDEYVFAVEELESGLLDAVILDEPVGETFEADRDVEVAFVFETGEEYGFAVRQDDEDLQEALSEGIAAVEDSSEYEEITREWFDPDEEERDEEDDEDEENENGDEDE